MSLNTTTHPIHSASIGKRMVQGGAIAFVLMAIFIFGVDNPDPLWGKFWMVRPLVVVTVAGAMGGIFYFFMDHLRYQGGWKKFLAYVISFFGYLVAVWLGSVVGLDGTLWN